MTKGFVDEKDIPCIAFFEEEYDSKRTNYPRGTDSSPCAATGIVSNRVYNFRVAAYNPDGYSAWTYGEFQVPNPLPAAPTDLTFSDHSPENRSVVMTWTDASTDEPGFRVEYSVDGGTTWRAAANLEADAISRAATGIVAGRRYDSRVAARNVYSFSD